MTGRDIKEFLIIGTVWVMGMSLLYFLVKELLTN